MKYIKTMQLLRPGGGGCQSQRDPGPLFRGQRRLGGVGAAAARDADARGRARGLRPELGGAAGGRPVLRVQEAHPRGYREDPGAAVRPQGELAIYWMEDNCPH